MGVSQQYLLRSRLHPTPDNVETQVVLESPVSENSHAPTSASPPSEPIHTPLARNLCPELDATATPDKVGDPYPRVVVPPAAENKPAEAQPAADPYWHEAPPATDQGHQEGTAPSADPDVASFEAQDKSYMSILTFMFFVGKI